MKKMPESKNIFERLHIQLSNAKAILEPLILKLLITDGQSIEEFVDQHLFVMGEIMTAIDIIDDVKGKLGGTKQGDEHGKNNFSSTR